jgi:hypothetical protein
VSLVSRHSSLIMESEASLTNATLQPWRSRQMGDYSRPYRRTACFG